MPISESARALQKSERHPANAGYRGFVMRIAKSAREIANELVADGILRCDQVLEMGNLYPRWLVALYIRAVRLRVAFGVH